MKANKTNVLFITASKGFSREGVIGDGYNVVFPYVEHNLLERILREFCFRIPFLPSRLWFNKEVHNYLANYIFVSDPLITVEYLKWVQKVFPNAQLNYSYGNMIGRAKHVLPSQIPLGWRVWTYDDNDARKYGLRLYHTNAYPKFYLKPLQTIEYDVLFVGADKGRGEYLLQLQGKMISMGLRTKFIIAPDGRLSKKKSYYHKPIPYREVVDLIVRSKAILNVAMEGQEGMTLRDLESMFFGVKLLTTNRNVVNFDLYCPENVYIVDGLNIDDLPHFLELKMVNVPEDVKECHSLDHFVKVLTEAD